MLQLADMKSNGDTKFDLAFADAYNPDWVALWLRTRNFRLWARSASRKRMVSTPTVSKAFPEQNHPGGSAPALLTSVSNAVLPLITPVTSRVGAQVASASSAAVESTKKAASWLGNKMSGLMSKIKQPKDEPLAPDDSPILNDEPPDESPSTSSDIPVYTIQP